MKLWVSEWLDGTTRFELTAEQRLLWIDLLALAGRSRFPGMIYAGIGEGEKKVGYPLTYLAGILSFQPAGLREALSILERHHHIEIFESAPECLVLSIINWDKYQSEYQRQKASRKEVAGNVRTKTRPSAGEVTPQNTVRLLVEGEVEIEGEGEVEKKTPSPAKPAGGVLGSPEFKSFWEAFPKKVDRQEALHAWVKGLCDGSIKEILLGLEKWKRTEQWTDSEKIPYPSTWLSKKRWKEVPELPARKETLHEQLERLGARP